MQGENQSERRPFLSHCTLYLPFDFGGMRGHACAPSERSPFDKPHVFLFSTDRGRRSIFNFHCHFLLFQFGCFVFELSLPHFLPFWFVGFVLRFLWYAELVVCIGRRWLPTALLFFWKRFCFPSLRVCFLIRSHKYLYSKTMKSIVHKSQYSFLCKFLTKFLFFPKEH